MSKQKKKQKPYTTTVTYSVYGDVSGMLMFVTSGHKTEDAAIEAAYDAGGPGLYTIVKDVEVVNEPKI